METIIYIVVGVVVGIAVINGIIVFCYRHSEEYKLDQRMQWPFNL